MDGDHCHHLSVAARLSETALAGGAFPAGADPLLHPLSASAIPGQPGPVAQWCRRLDYCPLPHGAGSRIVLLGALGLNPYRRYTGLARALSGGRPAIAYALLACARSKLVSV